LQKNKRVVIWNPDPKMVIIDPPVVVSNDGSIAKREVGGRYWNTAKEVFQKKFTKLLVIPTKTLGFGTAQIGLEQVNIDDDRKDALTTEESNLQAKVRELRTKLIPKIDISV